MATAEKQHEELKRNWEKFRRKRGGVDVKDKTSCRAWTGRRKRRIKRRSRMKRSSRRSGRRRRWRRKRWRRNNRRKRWRTNGIL